MVRVTATAFSVWWMPCWALVSIGEAASVTKCMPNFVMKCRQQRLKRQGASVVDLLNRDASSGGEARNLQKTVR
jgi:hypothetical protein